MICDTITRERLAAAALSSVATIALVVASAAPAKAEPRAATATQPPVDDGLPMPGFAIEPGTTALVITDPQNDFLSPEGVTWGVVGESVAANRTVENIEDLFLAADRSKMPIFISPHYYYEHDHRWKFEGTLETLMHGIGMFDRPHALTLEGFEGSGADWLERYKPVIENGRTVVTARTRSTAPIATISSCNCARRGFPR
ncbi:isochorismatase family protein [Citromicrobium bathyomarinum]|uniref:isochorismatase family protein n=1 Tax=Citromicrobium bathyomarinum TaxID=72174 RepID=UPI00315B3318